MCSWKEQSSVLGRDQTPKQPFKAKRRPRHNIFRDLGFVSGGAAVLQVHTVHHPVSGMSQVQDVSESIAHTGRPGLTQPNHTGRSWALTVIPTQSRGCLPQHKKRCFQEE